MKKKHIAKKKPSPRAKKPKQKKLGRAKFLKNTKVVKPVKKKLPVRTIKKKKRSAQTVRTRTKPVESKPQRLVVVDGTKKTTVPLVVEPYPKDYTGLPFLTLIQFRKQPMLVIVDNVDDQLIKAYVLDLCGPEQVDEEKVILAASEWYAQNKSNYPVSIEFSRRGMTNETSRIYRTFDVEFVSRVIGPAPEFPMNLVKSVKRRRRKAVPQGVEIHIGSVTPLEQFFTT
jgi:hypothetical protein